MKTKYFIKIWFRKYLQCKVIKSSKKYDSDYKSDAE